jgi:3-hydroxyisobutyrate dehydrogenase
MTTHVAFLGLGTMGSGMARRILDAGFPLIVHNRSREKAEALITAGAVWADSPREAAATADAVIAMVADDGASRGLWLGHNGALAGLKAGALAIESSTLSPGWIGELHAAAGAAEIAFLDAPVTGSKPQAAAGELIFMVGGEPATLERARPLLNAMGRIIAHVGGPGSGSRVKLLNNFLAGVQAASFAEALAWMDRTGIDPAKAMEVLLPGAAGSPMIKNLYNRIQSNDSTVYFYLHLMAKDLLYARDEGRAYGLTLRTASAAAALFNSAIEHGDGDRDISAVVRQFREQS